MSEDFENQVRVIGVKTGKDYKANDYVDIDNHGFIYLTVKVDSLDEPVELRVVKQNIKGVK